ncbi:MAG: hypothetical protein ACE37F_30540 [Nannocystaceae bacterium]|nr:hypothetical protein [bacterium]
MPRQHLISSVLGLTALLCSACAEGPDTASEPGSLRMGVVGQDGAGQIYRLRDGVFDIDGPEAVSVSTESSPISLETLDVELAAGSYDVTLGGGWRLERWDPISDATLDVAATLTSANPATVLVTGTETTSVVFTFSVPDAGPVTLGDGELEIDIEVDVDDPGGELTPCDPLSPACAPGEGCYPVGGDPVAFGCAPIYDEAGLHEPCEFVNGCSAGLFCSDPSLNTSCPPDLGCCLQYCDVSSPACGAGEFCLGFGAENPDIGVCGT